MRKFTLALLVLVAFASASEGRMIFRNRSYVSGSCSMSASQVYVERSQVVTGASVVGSRCSMINGRMFCR